MSVAPMKDAQYVVLRKLSDIGSPLNILEIGFSASPQVVRNLAARGLVKVSVHLTERGAEAVQSEALRRKRKIMKAQKIKQAADREFRLAQQSQQEVA